MCTSGLRISQWLVSFIIVMMNLVACSSQDPAVLEYYKIRDAFAEEAALFDLKLKNTPFSEQRELISEAPDRSGYVDTLLAFINKHPEADFVVDALLEIYYALAGNFRDVRYAKVMKALITEYPSSASLARMDPILISNARSPYIDAWVAAVLEKNTHHAVLGIFKLAKANRLLQSSNPDDEAYDLGLALLDTVIMTYADITMVSQATDRETTLGEIASDTKRRYTDLAVGKAAPEIISIDLNGQKVKLSDYGGKVVVIDIWATWCGPCIQMIPHQREMVERLKDAPFELISISIDNDLETVKHFQKKTPMPWSQWYNGSEGGILSQWNITAYPTIIIIDQSGIIRHRINGSIMGKQLDQLVDGLLEG